MSIPAGQAAKQGLIDSTGNAGRWLHRALQLVLALVILAIIGVSTLAIRLSQGPMDVAWLVRRITHNATGAEAVSIGKATLSWQGLGGGLDRTLDLVLSDITVNTAPGEKALDARRLELAILPRALLHGALSVRSAEAMGLLLKLRRDATGAIAVDTPTSPSLSATSQAGKPRDYRALLENLDHVRISDSQVSVADAQLGIPWALQAIDVDIRRADNDGAKGTATVTLALASETIRLDSQLTLLPQAAGVTITAALSPTNPARLAALAPKLAPLAALDAPLTLSGEATLGPDFQWRTATIKASAEPGTMHIGEGTMPLRAASITADITPTQLDLRIERLMVRAREEVPPTTITARVSATRASGKINATASVDIDQAAFADLPVLWPAGVGGPGTRPWITQNITAGTARNGHVDLTVTAPEDFSDAALTSITGGMDGIDITGHWLRPVPPIEHGTARVSFVDPDTMDIFITTGRQAGGQLSLRPSRVRLTGLAGHDQFIAIQGDIVGPFADLITLLRYPKIHLLDRRPIDLRDPQGSMTGQLTVNFPLKNDLDIDNVAIHATGKLSGGHLTGIAVGRDIDRAALDFDVNNDGLKVTGPADIAGIPAQLKIDMDFRNGGPTQVMEKIGVTASVTPKQISNLGLNTDGVMAGVIDIQLDYLDRRDMTGDLLVSGNLAKASIEGGRFPFAKATGAAATLDAHVLLKGGKVVSIDRIRAEAPGLSVLMNADTANGRPNLVRIQRFILGDTTNIQGEVRLPERGGDPYVADITGSSLDVSREFDRKTQPGPPKPDTERGPAFRADAKIDRVLMAGGRALTKVVAHVENDGLVTRNARLSAIAGTGPAALSLTPVQGGRRLAGEAQDAGALLRTLDIIQTMSGGHLTVAGAYDDTKPTHPLRGTAEISDFRIRNAPSIGRILQGMSLYGLLELAQGPGLGFTRLVAPFRMSQEVLSLDDARAYSASLGITAKGSIDLARQTADMEGTVIPAYFFNSLLGRVPLLGKLFAPEEGGGVFAASYSVKGKLDDPAVSVNPLAALTPGFLRGFFDIFESSPSSGPPPPPRPTIQEPQR